MIEVFWSFCCCCCSCYCYCVSSFFLLHFLSFFPFVHVFVSFSCFFFFFFSSSSLMMIVVMAANWTNIEATLNSLELIWFVSNDHFNMFNPNMFITPSSTPNTTPKLWKSGVKDPKTPQKKKRSCGPGGKYRVPFPKFTFSSLATDGYLILLYDIIRSCFPWLSVRSIYLQSAV